jgi:hypothetical protein
MYADRMHGGPPHETRQSTLCAQTCRQTRPLTGAGAACARESIELLNLKKEKNLKEIANKVRLQIFSFLPSRTKDSRVDSCLFASL